MKNEEKNKNPRLRPRPSRIGLWISEKLGVKESLKFDPDSLARQLGFPFDQDGKIYESY